MCNSSTNNIIIKRNSQIINIKRISRRRQSNSIPIQVELPHPAPDFNPLVIIDPFRIQ